MMNVYSTCSRLTHPTPQSPSPCLSLEQKLQKLNVCFTNLSTAREGYMTKLRPMRCVSRLASSPAVPLVSVLNGGVMQVDMLSLWLFCYRK